MDFLLNFIIHNQWNNVLVLTDYDTRALMGNLSSVFVKSKIIEMNSNASVSTLLATFTALEHGHQHVILWCKNRHYLKFVTSLQRLDIFGKRFTWLIVEDTLKGLGNVKFLETELGPSSHVYILAVPNSGQIQSKLVELRHVRFNLSNQMEVIPHNDLNARRVACEAPNLFPLRGYVCRIVTFHHSLVNCKRQIFLQPIMSGCRKRIVNRTVLPLRLGVHPPATGPTERQIASTEAKQKLRESRCIHAFVPDEHSGGLFESCKDPDMASPMLMIPTARLQAEPSDENEGETNEPGLKKLIENEKVGRVEDTEKKEMRDWGRHVNELCCDAEAWQNSPLPYNLLKWPSESKQINICAATMGPTCDDFLKLNRDTRTTKPKKPILPMITEYKAMIDQPDNMLPVEKPKVLASYAPRANMLDPLPPRYAANAEYWQAVNADIWDRTMSNTRDIVKKPFDVLPDAKAPSKKYIRRKYGKDTDWLEPDEELLELSQTDKLRVELKKPMSGYTGTRRNYYNPCWPRAVDDKPSYNDYVYKTTSHLSHRSFPPSEYCIRSSTFGRKGDLSRAVTNLIPPHPFRLYRRERFGRWDVDVPTHKFW